VVGPVEQAAAAEEGPLGDDGGTDSDGFGSAFTGLVNTGAISSEVLIEEPVASGGDSTMWTDGEDDGTAEDEDCEPGDQRCKDGQP
jgi:hypothetical protein